jgi:hypothetical protein
VAFCHRLHKRVGHPPILAEMKGRKLTENDTLKKSLSPTSPRLHIAIKSEDYGLKAVSLITGKGQKVPAAAVFALQADKAVVEIAAVQIPVNELLNIRTEKSI